MNPLETLAHLAAVGTPPADGDALARLSVGLDDSLARFEREELAFASGGGAELRFVIGPYGRGKTHYLQALRNRAQEAGFVSAMVDCQEQEAPFKSIVDTYRSIARCMEPPRPGPYFSTTGIGKVLESRFSGRTVETQRLLIERLKSDYELGADYRNLVIAYSTEALLGGSDEELADALEALLAATPSYRVTLGRLYKEYPQLARPLGKLGPRNAMPWLRALLSLPRVIGYPGLVVLFDETERAIVRGGARKRQEHLAHIRTFVDHMALGAFQGCVVYYAVAEEFIEEARRDLAALSQRVERVRIPGLGEYSNPRAVWVELDELTAPGPADCRFFEDLAHRIVDIGIEAGLSTTSAEDLVARMQRAARTFAEDSIHEGRVREFAKQVASEVAQSLNSNRQ